MNYFFYVLIFLSIFFTFDQEKVTAQNKFIEEQPIQKRSDQKVNQNQDVEKLKKRIAKLEKENKLLKKEISSLNKKMRQVKNSFYHYFLEKFLKHKKRGETREALSCLVKVLEYKAYSKISN